MATEVINSLWIDDEIGVIQRMCYNSYLEMGHQVHVYTYGIISNIPEGVVLKDANEIIPQNKVFKDFRNSYATFSDWFRIALLYEYGGWWVDSDTICLKQFELDEDYAFATEIVNEVGEIAICNAFIKMPKKSQLGQQLLSEIEKTIQNRDPLSLEWTEIGAALLKDKIIALDLDDNILSPDVFCPINYFNFSKLYEEKIQFGPDTYAIHLWNKMWEWGDIKPENDFATESLIEIFKSKYDY